MRALICSAITLWSVLAVPLVTGAEGLYGPEFTFALDGQSITPEKKQELIDHMVRHLVHNQPEGAKFSYGDLQHTFTSPNGWSFRVSTDPGVVEITMEPMPLVDWRRFKDDIQDAIFVSAANVGLFPWDYLGGGHLNISYKVFGESILLARNFVVDFWNHNELAMGILNFDLNNAFPAALFFNASIDELKSVLTRMEAGEFLDGQHDIAEFFLALNNKLSSAPTWNSSSAGKMRDLNFKTNRIELRAVRPQASMEVWINQIELIEKRIDYLKRFNKPIPLNPRVPIHRFDAENDNHVPPISPSQALRSFYLYVTEAGLKWENHRVYIWPNWVRDGELQKFESSDFFLKRQKNSCAEDLDPS